MTLLSHPELLGFEAFFLVMALKKRPLEMDEKPDAHARRLALDHIDADIAFAFEQAQITLHGAAALAERLHEQGDGDFAGAVRACVAVGVLGELARATAGAVGEVGVVAEAGGELGDVGAVVLRRSRARPLMEGIAVAGLQRCAAALFSRGAVGSSAEIHPQRRAIT